MSNALRAILTRFRGLFAGPSADRELHEEMESHIHMATEEHQRRGLSPEAARRAALLEFGGVAQAQEAYRERRGVPLVTALLQDARWSIRSLSRNVSFTVAVLLTLTVGIGATSAMLTVVDRVILHPVPYPAPQQLAYLGWSWLKGDGSNGLSARKFTFWHDNARSFSAVATVSPFAATIDEDARADESTPLRGARITSDFFRAIGMNPASGRAFAPDEFSETPSPIVILSNAAWQTRYAGESRIVGRVIRLNGAPVTVVGVMPPAFDLAGPAERADVLVPMAMSAADLANRANDYMTLARIKPGVSSDAVASDMKRVFEAYRDAYPDLVADDDRGVRLMSFATTFVGSYQRIIWIIFAATVLLFVLACANVANLLLVRTLGQRPQFAVCLALGARRARVVSRVVIEAVILGFSGATLAVIASIATLHGILAISNGNLLIDLRRAGIDLRAAAWIVAATVGTLAVMGCMAALSTTGVGLASGLAQAGRRGSLSRTQQRATSVLVGLQAGLASVLLIAAAALIASFGRLLRIDPGFARNGVVTAAITRVPSGYDSSNAVNALANRVLDRLRQDPSIESAALASSLPLQRGLNLPMELTDNPEIGEGAAEWRAASPTFFYVYGIPVLRGRAIGDADREGSEPVVVVSQSLASKYWPNGNALGQRITIGRFHGRLLGPKFADEPRTVIGVVPDLRDVSLEQRQPRRTVWIPWSQVPRTMVASRIPSFAVRTRDVHAATIALHDALTDGDRRLSNTQVAAMNTVVSNSLASRRFNLVLVASFAAIALILTCVGVYGVVAYSVARRTSEIAIRMALGAVPQRVVLMMLGQGMRPVVIGLIAGLLASTAVRAYLAALLYEVRPNDPEIVAAAMIVLVLMAAIANYIPARRAARANPVQALRME